jgi:hypothetical protein
MNESRMPFRIIITGTADPLFAQSIAEDVLKSIGLYNSIDIQYGATAVSRLVFGGES